MRTADSVLIFQFSHVSPVDFVFCTRCTISDHRPSDLIRSQGCWMGHLRGCPS